MKTLSGNSKESAVAVTERRSSACTITSLVCLNFKVPMRVRQQFKICAARNNMSMTELLLKLLADYLADDATNVLSTRSEEKL